MTVRPSSHVNDEDFLRLMTVHPAVTLRSLLREPTPHAQRIQSRLTRGCHGAELEARRVLLQVYATHGLLGSEPLIIALARQIAMTRRGHSLLAPLLTPYRHRLLPEVVRAARWLAGLEQTFNYATLYSDLKYFTGRTAERWQVLADTALTPAPEVLSL